MQTYGREVWRVIWKFWGCSDTAYNDFNCYISPSEFYHIKDKNELVCYISCERIK